MALQKKKNPYLPTLFLFSPLRQYNNFFFFWPKIHPIMENECLMLFHDLIKQFQILFICSLFWLQSPLPTYTFLKRFLYVIVLSFSRIRYTPHLTKNASCSSIAWFNNFRLPVPVALAISANCNRSYFFKKLTFGI